VTVLVTGAQGFVGAWLAERLLDDGRRVVALRRDVDPESRFRAEGIEDRCILALADLTDHDALLRVLNEHEVDEVFHLAAQTIVATANRSPLATWEANVRGTWSLLEACRSLGTVRRVVVARPTRPTATTASCPTARISRSSRATRTTSRRRAPT
jgi:CDP-glucose 4,6-dehydratase